MSARNDDMGPLPEGDRQDTLQQLSLSALRNRLPEDKFLFRREPEEDKGIDGTLEAKVKGRFTNCRANAQLKSTDHPKRNLDGSVSYSIETSNLNYLLNGPCPIYFLWLDPSHEMRYAWAWDEWRRLDVETPGWRDQGTFTVRFRKVLDTLAVEAIFERILTEARFRRQIHEKVAQSSLAERVVVSINPQTLVSDDPQELFGWITANGMTIVSSGYGSLVMEWLNVLNSTQRRDARVQLVAAYAQGSLGRYHAALGNLAEARTGLGSLSASDQRSLNYLQGVCCYQTGGMEQVEYLRREHLMAERLTGTPAAEHRLEVLRLERLNETDGRIRAELLARMRETSRDIEAAPDATLAVKIRSRVDMMYAEGDDLVGWFSKGAIQVQTWKNMGLPAHEADRQTARDVAAAWQRWDDKARTIIQEAESEKHPLLVAEAMTARLTVYQCFLASDRMLASTSDTLWEPDLANCEKLVAEVTQATEVFRRADSLEGETRSKLLLADFRYLMGDRKAAEALAEEAMVVAQAMGYSRLEEHASEYTDGPTSFERFRATIAKQRAQDRDEIHANHSDEQVTELAQRCLEMMRLPTDRLPVLVRESQSAKLIARASG